MPRGSGSRRFMEKAYPLLLEEGAMNTDQIVDALNERRVYYNGAPRGRRTKETWSVHQAAQILRTSRWFKKVGEDRAKTFSGATRVLFIYDVIPIEEVVAKMVGFKHKIQKRNTIPNFAEAEYQRQEALLDGN